QLPSAYLHHEERLVRMPAFLEAHLPIFAERVAGIVAELRSRPYRLRTILEKVLAVELMENWFRALSSRQPLVKLMHYENLCTDPLSQFQIAADFLGIPWDASLSAAVLATTSVNATSGHRHSIHRDTAAQLNRPWRFLTPGEVAEGYKLIERLRA
ncbi:MAG: sulfotransferase domain-containing protein, partial [Verrucomicrobiota bacterium]